MEFGHDFESQSQVVVDENAPYEIVAGRQLTEPPWSGGPSLRNS